MKLIDKDALVAEIERLVNNYDKALDYEAALEDVRNFINTLEVKEVDLEKEAELIANGIMIDVQANKYNTVVYNSKRNDFNHSHLMLAAKKGIELGLKGHINSLKVKEVDFDAEWVKYFENRGEMATVNIKHLAEHFFALGMSVSNKAQKGEK